MPEVERLAAAIIRNVERVIVGKHDEITVALAAILANGHILLEDVPGVGKTVLAKAIATSIGCTFRRIQFTPDLLPGDVTGVSVYNQRTGEFEYRPGPVESQILLADEINRATPKTQSALLEAMEERQVTVDGVTFPLPAPFVVLATDNPIEYEGTFPLPEAQLDRFLIRLSLGYPSRGDEVAVLESQHEEHPLVHLTQVVDVESVLEAQGAVKQVYVDRSIAEYIVDLVSATRKHPDVYLGASPRGSLALYRISQAYAAIQGRDFVIPDDVKSLVVPVLAHRLILDSAARMRGVSPAATVQWIASQVQVPGSRVAI